MDPVSLTRRAIAAAAVTVLLLTADALAEPAEKIRFCDELLVTIAGSAIVHHQVTVAASGLIEIPEVGAHPAAGLGKRELATSIATLLGGSGPGPRVSVAIVRRDAPGCSFIELPPTPLPEPAPIPTTELNTQTELEIQLDLPDTFDTTP